MFRGTHAPFKKVPDSQSCFDGDRSDMNDQDFMILCQLVYKKMKRKMIISGLRACAMVAIAFTILLLTRKYDGRSDEAVASHAPEWPIWTFWASTGLFITFLLAAGYFALKAETYYGNMKDLRSEDDCKSIEKKESFKQAFYSFGLAGICVLNLFISFGIKDGVPKSDSTFKNWVLICALSTAIFLLLLRGFHWIRRAKEEDTPP